MSLTNSRWRLSGWRMWRRERSIVSFSLCGLATLHRDVVESKTQKFAEQKTFHNFIEILFIFTCYHALVAGTARAVNKFVSIYLIVASLSENLAWLENWIPLFQRSRDAHSIGKSQPDWASPSKLHMSEEKHSVAQCAWLLRASRFCEWNWGFNENRKTIVWGWGEKSRRSMKHLIGGCSEDASEECWTMTRDCSVSLKDYGGFCGQGRRILSIFERQMIQNLSRQRGP